MESEEWEHIHALSFLEATIHRRKGKTNISQYFSPDLDSPSQDSTFSDGLDDTSDSYQASADGDVIFFLINHQIK